jgi:hypothetical protein
MRCPADYDGALQLLHRVIEESSRGEISDERWLDCLRSFGTMVDRDLVAPLNKKAMQTQDPIQRILYGLLGETVRTLHLQTPTIRRKLAELELGRRGGSDKEVFQNLEQFRRSTNDFLRLIKALRG